MQIDAEVLGERPRHGEADGHQGRLSVLGEGEVGLRSLAHEAGEVLAQGLVHGLEHLAGGGEGFGQLGAHADGLAALSGKEEGESHAKFRPCAARVRL